MNSQLADWTKTGAGLALLVAIVGLAYGWLVAATFIVSALTAWVNIFCVLHALIWVARRRPVSRLTVALGSAGLASSFFLLYFGQWAPLAMLTGSFLVIDAFVVHFNAPPMGHAGSAGEP